MTEHSSTSIKTARILVYIGLIPFVIALLSSLLTDHSNLVLQSRFAIVIYAALILGCSGAIHWGVLLNAPDEQANWMFIVSIIPLGLSLITILTPYQYALGILFFSFIGLYQYEKKYLWNDFFPEWFQVLRTHITFSISAILLLIWIINLNK